MTTLKKIASFGLLVFVASESLNHYQSVRAQEKKSQPELQATKSKEVGSGGWRTLLAKDSLDGWKSSEFGGDGEVKVENGELHLGMGQPLTGVTYTREFPKSGFEIKADAQRIEGGDFFCGLTFPVGDGFASLIAGGWGGGVVGLSSIDGYDASENPTSTYEDFDNGKWYSFRVRVDDKNVTAWIDDKEVFSQEREGHKFSLRGEVYASRPLGYCVFQSKVAVRNFQWRDLKDEKKGSKTAK